MTRLTPLTPQRAQDELKAGNLDVAKQMLDECIGIGDFESSGGRRFQHPDVYAAYVRVAKARFERDLTTKTEREDALQDTYVYFVDALPESHGHKRC